MQSKLEMSRAGRHHKLSPPRLNLRRSTSYQHEKAPGSATGSRFSLNHLFFSPPPSPGLPALVPRAKKSPVRARPTRVFRILTWAAGALFIIYVVARTIGQHVDLLALRTMHRTGEREDYGMVSQDALPDFPTPIMAKDRLGRSSWTVSIPKDYVFPLGVTEYAEIMGSCHEVASTVSDLKRWTRRGDEQTFVREYGMSDPNYVDVRQAEKSGLLPMPSSDQKNTKRGSGQGNLVGVSEDPSMPECDTSLTVVLESSDASLGNTLMMLWTFYGIAKEQGRAFFVDDSRWAYGKYTSMFGPPPVPACRPPARHEMVPCPTQASHLVVSAVTARDVLMDSLSTTKRTDLQNGHSEKARKTLFDLARIGYEALFQIIKEDADYVDRRVADLSTKAAAAGGSGPQLAPVVGMHVRRGDCRPLNSPYRNSYIPHDVYSGSARAAVSSRPGDPLLVLASDDPTIYDAEEFRGAHHAQERIKLASKEPGPKGPRNPHVFHRFIDEGFGWEGGFFSAMFWNLGLSRGAGVGTFETSSLGEETVRLRAYLGRAYVLDLAVLAKGSDAVVCGVASMGCRLLGVMMGWEAIEQGRWVNVDGGHTWMGLTW